MNSAVTNWLTITTDVQFNHGVRNGNTYIASKTNPIFNALNYDPTMDMFTEDGKYNVGKTLQEVTRWDLSPHQTANFEPMPLLEI